MSRLSVNNTASTGVVAAVGLSLAYCIYFHFHVELPDSGEYFTEAESVAATVKARPHIQTGATHQAPKQGCLSKTETINTFENWKQNLLYTLSLEKNFAPFLAEGVAWLKKTKAQLLRRFQNEGEGVPVARRRTAQQKVNSLELSATYCPIISRSTIVKKFYITGIHMANNKATPWFSSLGRSVY